MQIENRHVSSLIPYEHNPRKNDHAVERVADAIRAYGFRVPILVRSDGQIIDGHLRLKAAEAAGLDEVPVLIADDLTDEQVRAFRISVNKMAELAKWDWSLLREELSSLLEAGCGLEPIGFSESEMDDLKISLSSSGQTDPDEIPPEPEVPTTQPGDLWHLGAHRLLCADATDQNSYKRLLTSQVDLLLTDPPYGVAYEGKAGKIKNDDLSSAALHKFLASTFTAAAEVLSPGGPVYVFHADAGEIGLIFRQTFLQAGFKLASTLIWRKNNARMSRADYHWQHEPILYGWRKGAPHRWFGGRKRRTMQEAISAGLATIADDGRFQIQAGDKVVYISGDNLDVEIIPGSVISHPAPLRNAEHPTMKPVGLLEKLIANSSCRGDRVLDPFLGSGSTLMACEQRGRVCHGIELEPRFCDVIIKRWQDFTGRSAIHAETGKDFSELSDQVEGAE